MPQAVHRPVFQGSFTGPQDEYNPSLGVRPVAFDILAPDMQTSILPDGLVMVLHANPSNMTFTYQKTVNRIQTKGGWVEQHWGNGTQTISLEAVTGGFKRLYSGMSNVTGGPFSNVGGTRRETLAYDKYEDIKALFKNNGAIIDSRGQIVFHGAIRMTYDGGTYIGWFTSFTTAEAAEKPFMFTLSAEFTVAKERKRILAAPQVGSFDNTPSRGFGGLPQITRAN